MLGLIRSASLTITPNVARRAGLDPGRMLREFDLPQRCLEDAGNQDPDRLGAPPAGGLGATGAASRRSDCSWPKRGACSDLGPLGCWFASSRRCASRSRRSRATGGGSTTALLLAIEESRRRRRAARGTDRRPRGLGTAVDGARDRRRVPDAAHAARRRVATAARVLRARCARRPFGARARVRSQRGVRTRLQRHRVRARRPRSAESQRRPGDGESMRSSCSKQAWRALRTTCAGRCASWS